MKKIILFSFLLTTFLCGASETNTEYVLTAGQEDEPNMILSQETNSIRSGVWINNSNHVLVVQSGNMVSQAELVLLNTSTNGINFWYFWPSTDLGYQIRMTDKHGLEVPKTSFGERFGRPPKRNPDNASTIGAQRFGLHGGKILPKDEMYCGDTTYDPIKNLPKCFEIEKLGNYKLTLIHHIYVMEQRTNGFFLKRITFSPVTVDVRVESIGK